MKSPSILTRDKPTRQFRGIDRLYSFGLLGYPYSVNAIGSCMIKRNIHRISLNLKSQNIKKTARSKILKQYDYRSDL